MTYITVMHKKDTLDFQTQWLIVNIENKVKLTKFIVLYKELITHRTDIAIIHYIKVHTRNMTT